MAVQLDETKGRQIYLFVDLRLGSDLQFFVSKNTELHLRGACQKVPCRRSFEYVMCRMCRTSFDWKEDFKDRVSCCFSRSTSSYLTRVCHSETPTFDQGKISSKNTIPSRRLLLLVFLYSKTMVKMTKTRHHATVVRAFYLKLYPHHS